MGDTNIYDILGMTPGDQAQTEGWFAEIRTATDGLIAALKQDQEGGEEVDPLAIFLSFYIAVADPKTYINVLAIAAELIYRQVAPREEVPPL